MEDYKRKIEAVLFASGKFLEIEKIAEMLGLGSLGMVTKTLEELKQDYSQKDSAIEILQEGNKYRMNIKSNFIPIVKSLMTETEFERPTISTLAIIAWKQPILQSKVIKLRGNTAYEHLKLLEQKELISRKPHKLTRILKLTPKFYEYFDTNKSILESQLPKETIENPILKEEGKTLLKEDERNVQPVEQLSKSKDSRQNVVSSSEESQEPKESGGSDVPVS